MMQLLEVAAKFKNDDGVVPPPLELPTLVAQLRETVEKAGFELVDRSAHLAACSDDEDIFLLWQGIRLDAATSTRATIMLRTPENSDAALTLQGFEHKFGRVSLDEPIALYFAVGGIFYPVVLKNLREFPDYSQPGPSDEEVVLDFLRGLFDHYVGSIDPAQREGAKAAAKPSEDIHPLEPRKDEDDAEESTLSQLTQLTLAPADDADG